MSFDRWSLRFVNGSLYELGQYELSRMMPTEIGYAAAYEAYRTWIHNSSIYEPLSGDVDRQREGMVGLAVGEGRPFD